MKVGVGGRVFSYLVRAKYALDGQVVTYQVIVFLQWN